MSRGQPTSDVLIAGQGRSGTTWVGQVLGKGTGACYVHEPDDERRDPQALRAALKLGHTAILDDAEGPPPASFEAMWRGVFAGGRPGADLRSRAARRLLRSVPRPAVHLAARSIGATVDPRLRVVAALARPRTGPRPDVVVAKSVNVLLSLRWVARRFAPGVVIVTRHPLDVLASRLELGWGTADIADNPTPFDGWARARDLRPFDPAGSELAQMSWQIGLFGTALREAADKSPGWQVVRHEDLCRNPIPAFRGLSERLGLEWSPDQERALAASDQPGRGWETKRVTASLPGAWQRRLSPGQVREARAVLDDFPDSMAGYE